MADAKVVLASDELGVALTARLDGDVPTITEGYGGWGTIEREKRKPLTVFAGAPTVKQTFGIVLDGFLENRTVDNERALLSALASSPDDDEIPPPVIRLAGGVERVDLPWVIESLTWGEAIRDTEGRYLRQQVSLVLAQYVDPNVVRTRPGKRPKGRDRARPKRYRVKAGDTLYKIAHRFYGSRKKWRKIAEANGLRSPTGLKKGQVLKLP